MEAAAIGLVLRTVPDNELLGSALDLADQIVENTPFGTWMGKATLWSNLEIASPRGGHRPQARTQILTITPRTEGTAAAWREKREPRYTNR